jgi:hypothetical protein
LENLAVRQRKAYSIGRPPADGRDVGAEDVIHDSVFGRWTADARYRPAALKAFATSGLDGLHRDT